MQYRDLNSLSTIYKFSMLAPTPSPVSVSKSFEARWKKYFQINFYPSGLRPKSTEPCKNLSVKKNPLYRRVSAGWPARTYLLWLCADTGCNLEDLPEAMDNRDRWRDIQGNPCCQRDLMMMMMMMMMNFMSITILWLEIRRRCQWS